MKMKNVIFMLLLILSVSCSSDGGPSGPIVGGPSDGDGNGDGGNGGNTNSITYTPTASLKNTADFPIGTVVDANKLTSGSYATFRTILNTEFNSVTAENQMKMAAMFTGPDSYNFSNGDAIANYAKANGMRVHGHALIWHSSIPNWLQNFSGTDEEFAGQVERYVKATVAHFATVKDGNGNSIVESWDVVNEAFTSDANNAVFRQRIGNDYVAKCFQWAREADPNVKLFYNDYNLEWQGSKVADVINMVNNFKTNNIPIDGIGMQMHVDLTTSLSSLSSNLNELVNTGLLIHFSEMDLPVNKNKDITELTFERASAQQQKYKEIVALFNAIPLAQQFGITLWGMRDPDSWLISFLGNPNEWPLLFNANYEYKIAHKGFLEGLQ
jgi:endo-1,4-beta-xylanase